jgi:aldose 1-epimerase
LPDGWINNGYSGWTGVAVIHWPERGIGLKIGASAPFDCFQVYSPGRDSTFFCLEPVTHIADAFNRLEIGQPGSALLVRPGTTIRGVVEFAIPT